MTDLRTTQATLEAWLQNPPSLRASQVALEVWITTSAEPTAFRISQALLEVWTALPVAGWRRYRESASAV